MVLSPEIDIKKKIHKSGRSINKKKEGKGALQPVSSWVWACKEKEKKKKKKRDDCLESSKDQKERTYNEPDVEILRRSQGEQGEQEDSEILHRL